MTAQDNIRFAREFDCVAGIRGMAFRAASKLLSEIRELEAAGCSAQSTIEIYKRIVNRFRVGDAVACYEESIWDSMESVFGVAKG